MATDPPIARPISAPTVPTAGLRFLPVFLGAATIGASVFAAFHPALTAGMVGSADRAILVESQRDAWMMCSDAKRFSVQLVSPRRAAVSLSPLTRVSYAVDAYLSDTPLVQPFQVRLTNLTLHTLNAILLFVIAARWSGRVWIGLAAGLLFALHPLQAESVASFSRREVLLGGFFTLLMISAYLRFVRDARLRWTLPVYGWYLMAALASPLYVAAPLVLVLLDVWPLRRAGLQSLLEKSPMLVFLATAIGMTAWGAAPAGGSTARDLGWGEWLSLNVVSAVGRVVWPVRLSPFYPLSESVGVWPMVAAAVLAAGWLMTLLRRRAAFSAATGAAALTAPALWWSGSSGELLHDAWLYAVAVVPLLCLASACRAEPTEVPDRAGAPLPRSAGMSRGAGLSRVAPLVTAALIVTLGVLAYGQTLIWDNSRDLYAQVLARYPRWTGGHIGIIEACIDENDLDGALRHARRAIDLAPTDPQTQFYLGTVLLLHRDHRAAEAVAPLRRALESNRDWIACLQNLGVALARTGQTDDAIRFLERARDLDPNSAAIHVGLGHAYLRVERAASARREFQEALRVRSDWVVNLGLAAAWAMNDNVELARRHLAMAVAQEPSASARAATFDALRRLHDHPGFEALIDLSAAPPTVLEGVEWLPATGARGRQGQGA
ncbi:bacteriophage N4 receptor, outer membrane subunit [Phycisphaerae bacterium RAS2]|nr:bacteriophage N4 receptor, outer membrane subunit [Phycisphaerae bacterium RAS2]